MKQEQVIEFAEKSELCCVDRHGRVFSGFRDDVEIHEELMAFAKLVEQAVLERVADHFDKRGKNKDGEWCDGFYEPQEPGEIIRNLAKESQ